MMNMLVGSGDGIFASDDGLFVSADGFLGVWRGGLTFECILNIVDPKGGSDDWFLVFDESYCYPTF